MTRGFQQGRFADLPATPTRPHHFHGTEQRTVLVDGVDGWSPIAAHVRVFGEGPPLLLVHGLMTSSYSWRYTFDELGRHYTCFAPDLPGAGRSETDLAADFRPHGLARWLLGLQEALGIVGCDVIGNSMGGYLCMVMALMRPDAVGRLVNLHSPGVPVPKLVALQWALRVPGAKALLKRIVARDVLRWAHRNVHYYDESLKSLEEAHEYGDVLATEQGFGSFYKYLAETMSMPPMHAFAAALEERRLASLGFPVPLQLVYAEEDPMVAPEVGTVLARRVPDAEFAWLQEASHFAHVDATDRFCAVALDFLVGGR